MGMNNKFFNNLHSIISSSNNMSNLYNNMSSYQKQIFNNFLDNPDDFSNYSLNDLLFDFDKNFIEYLLNLELNLYLEETKQNGIDNKKNGNTKNIHLTMGNKEINFNRPRLRKENDFDSVLIPKRTRIIKDLSDNIILLYSKNNSINDIKDILFGMFGINVSTGFISNIAQNISQDVLNWRNRDLKPVYFTINIDCTYITIKDHKNLSSHKIPIYIAIGTNFFGNKEVLGMYLGNEDAHKNIIDNLYNINVAENKTFWLEVFNDLKDRGLISPLFIVSDGLSGIKEAINDVFPNSKYQRCIVHLVRDLQQYTNKNNKAMITSDFKKIYSAPNKELCISNYNDFLTKYADNSIIIKKATEYFDYILPLFDEPQYIRKYIYTNNIVESVNSKIKRGFYGRGALPNPESAINIIYLNLVDLEKKWSKTKVNNWNYIFNELSSLYYDFFKDYI